MTFCRVPSYVCGRFKPSARVAQPATGWLLFALAALACAWRPTRLDALTRSGVVHAYILIDAHSGNVLESYHAERLAHPASLTKLMTLYLTFQRLQRGRLHLDTRLPISRHAAAQQPTKLWLRPGGTITVRDAILGITTRSANDAAVVLAEYLGGAESRFAVMMNRTAQRLGMTRTRFYNASGLPNARQFTTARDMATLAVSLIDDFPQYYHFFAVRAFRFHGHIIYGHDHLLDQCAGVDGLKTGYIRTSGFNIVTSAVRHHRRLIGVVLGGATAWARDRQMIALINRGFRMRSPQPLLSARVTVPAHTRRARPELAAATAQEPPLSGSRNWVIQLGGNFHSASAVRRVLGSARRTAPASLREGRSLVVLLRGGRYRARFSRLDREQALQACSALRQRKFSCRILAHPEPSTRDLASAGEPASSQID